MEKSKNPTLEYMNRKFIAGRTVVHFFRLKTRYIRRIMVFWWKVLENDFLVNFSLLVNDTFINDSDFACVILSWKALYVRREKNVENRENDRTTWQSVVSCSCCPTLKILVCLPNSNLLSGLHYQGHTLAADSIRLPYDVTSDII